MQRRARPGRGTWSAAGAALLAMLALGGFVMGSHPAQAQTAATPGADILAAKPLVAEAPDAREASWQWYVYVDGERQPLPAPLRRPDSLRSLDGAGGVQAVARRVVEREQRAGHYLARLDSFAVDTSSAPAVVHLYVRRGPEVRVGRLRLRGLWALDAAAVRAALRTQAGERLRPSVLEADVQMLLDRYEAAGYPLAQVRVHKARLLPTDPPTLGLTLAVEEGPPLTLRHVEVAGAARTRAAFVRHVAGLRLGQPLTAYEPEEIRRRLMETGLFREVAPPELHVAGDSASIRLRLEEEPPGAFDLVLGYLPPEGGARGRLVGSGHLMLRNVLGGGRELALRLARRPGPASHATVQVSDPYLMGWPLHVEAAFEGFQQDSTYDQQRYRLGLGYRVTDGLMLRATAERRRTQPGAAGAARRGGRQHVPRSAAWFAGLGLRYRAVDDALSPRRGLWAEVLLERGRKAQSGRIGAGDTLRRTVRQQRLRGQLRAFVPTAPRHVLALGVEGALLVSDRYDLSALFRLGGARSLRGYDEDAFRGSAVARLLAEYRVHVDLRSFAYAFFDLGLVRTPALEAALEAQRDTRAGFRQAWYPGYGLGVQVDTRLGLVNASYAMNPRAGPLDGRLHLGLSVGL